MSDTPETWDQRPKNFSRQKIVEKTLREAIEADIKAIASIYPTAFDLYDEPLERLVCQLERTATGNAGSVPTEERVSEWWRKLRIVRDRFSGYEVQVKYVWWPFWHQLNFCNTSPTLELAEEYARNGAGVVVKKL